MGVLSAQTTTRHHELGIQLEQSYGFMYGAPLNFKTLYKCGKTDQAVWRFQLGNIQFGHNYYEPSQQQSTWMSLGGSIGREWRKDLNSNLRFFHGPLVGAEMSMSRSVSEVPPGTDNSYYYIMPNLIYVLNHSEAQFIVVENQHQLEKVRSIRNQLNHLKEIIVMDDRDAVAKQSSEPSSSANLFSKVSDIIFTK